jgi:hypothetical protein
MTGIRPGNRGAERFVRHEPLRLVHECVFGVLVLGSEPVDPRLGFQIIGLSVERRVRSFVSVRGGASGAGAPNGQTEGHE